MSEATQHYAWLQSGPWPGGWRVQGMRVNGEHAEVFDLHSPATDKRRLCLCVCAVCGKTWNEVDDAYPETCERITRVTYSGLEFPPTPDTHT